MKEFQRNLISDWHCQRRTKNEPSTNIDNIKKGEFRKMTHRLLNYYCQSEKTIFIKVAQDNGIFDQDKKLSVEYTAAIISVSNIGANVSRVK